VAAKLASILIDTTSILVDTTTTLDDKLDSILEDTGTTLENRGTSIINAVNSILSDTGTTLPSSISNILSTLDDNVANKLTSILTDTAEISNLGAGSDSAILSTLDSLLPSILADTRTLSNATYGLDALESLSSQILEDTAQISNLGAAGTSAILSTLDGPITTLLDSIVADTGAMGGAGAIEWTYTLTDSVTGLPIDGAEVWVTTDSAGANVIASGTTDSSGVATFWLDAATVYIWRKKAGYNFDNPDTEVIS